MENNTSFPGNMLVAVDSSLAVESTKFLATAGERRRYGPPSNIFAFPLNTREHPNLLSRQ
ncbi:MAG: hypothetical protein ACQCN3_04610 [Candidatus Bathyarchaeia archaeon]